MACAANAAIMAVSSLAKALARWLHIAGKRSVHSGCGLRRGIPRTLQSADNRGPRQRSEHWRSTRPGAMHAGLLSRNWSGDSEPDCAAVASA